MNEKPNLVIVIVLCATTLLAGFLFRGVFIRRDDTKLQSSLNDIRSAVDGIGDAQKNLAGAADTIQQLADAQQRTRDAIQKLDKKLTEFDQRERAIYSQLAEATDDNISSADTIAGLAADGRAIVTGLLAASTGGQD